MNSYLFAPPKFQPLDATGSLMPASYVQFYISGTTTPTDVYADAALTTPLANPVVADSDGLFPFVYMDGAVTYRVQFYNAADELQWNVDPYAPPRDYQPGTVLMFMGTDVQLEAAYPSALWQICDGTNGTYDMRGRAPVGVSSSIDPGEAIGSEGGPFTTSENGAHDHTGDTEGTAISSAQMPEHFHQCAIDVEDGDSTLVSSTLAMKRATSAGGDTEYRLRGGSADRTVSPTSPAGDGDPHDHGIPEDGAHTHTVTTGLPPSRGVWFVMRKYP